MPLVVLRHQLLAVREIPLWFPGVIGLWPSLPLNQVLLLTLVRS